MGTDLAPAHAGRRSPGTPGSRALGVRRAVPRLHDPRAGAVHPRGLRPGGPAAVAGATSSGTSSPGRSPTATSAASSSSAPSSPCSSWPGSSSPPSWPPTPSPSCEFPFRRLLFFVFMATLMLPIEVTLIPNVQTIRSLGWLNSYPGLVVPFLATAFGTFLLRQGFLGIPRDLLDAVAARRLRPPRLPAPGGHPRHPPGGRLVRGHRLPRRLEPVHLAPGRGHRGPLGDHPDRPQVRRHRDHRAATTSASPPPSSPPCPSCCS